MRATEKKLEIAEQASIDLGDTMKILGNREGQRSKLGGRRKRKRTL